MLLPMHVANSLLSVTVCVCVVCVCVCVYMCVSSWPCIQCRSCPNLLKWTSFGLTSILAAEACPPTLRTLGRAVQSAELRYSTHHHPTHTYMWTSGRVPFVPFIQHLLPNSSSGSSLDQCGGEKHRCSLVPAAGSHRHHCPAAHTETASRDPRPQLPHQQ